MKTYLLIIILTLKIAWDNKKKDDKTLAHWPYKLTNLCSKFIPIAESFLGYLVCSCCNTPERIWVIDSESNSTL